MKKIKLSLFPIIILAMLSCEPVTNTVTEYIQVIPDDPAEPDNKNVIGEWLGPVILWDFNADYTFTAYDTDGETVQYSGTYSIVESGEDAGIQVTDGVDTLIYWIVIVENYPDYRDISMNMRTDNGNWIYYRKVAD